MRNKYIGGFAVVLLAAFLFLLMQIAMLPLESGGAYPAYSTMRADPRGAKALYQSLAALKELKVEQNFQPLPRVKGAGSSIFLLGEAIQQTISWTEEELKLYESIVNDGGRLVICFLPVPPESPSDSKPRRGREINFVPAFMTRWHISVKRYTGTFEQVEEAGSMPRETSAYFETPGDSGWRVLDQNSQEDPTLVERAFGKGQIVLLTESYPLSNEGLRADRDTDLIATLAGPYSHLVFDESHLGVSNTGSVGTLIRRYRLTGAFAVMLLLGALFLWKNSTSLLPQAAESVGLNATGSDSQAGLVNLLKRSVAPGHLARACWDRWKETRTLGRPVSQQRIERAEALIATSTAAPAALYRNIQNILTEKT